MKPFVVLLLGFLFVIIDMGLAQISPFWIDCGSDSITNAEGRKWVGDSIPGSNYTLSSPGTIITSPTTSNGDPISKKALYESARVFNSSSNYNFSVIPMNYCIRLHFSLFEFDSLSANDSVFDVFANNIKLVSRFNVPEEIYWRSTMANLNSSSYLLKEYFVNVTSDELLIQFIPNPGSFAFVNAIEVIPVFNNLFADSVSKVGNLGTKTQLGLGERGIETMFRLNVGGPEIESTKDTVLWRRWESDEVFMFSLNAATKIANTSNISYASVNETSFASLLVYETARIMTDSEVVERRFNLSWRFNVDPNFDYLVRLHFCELAYNKANQRDFKIYINNRTAAEDYDVFVRAGGMNRAYHEDYYDIISPQIDTLWVQLGPDSLTSSSGGTDALLNGLEVFKLSRNGNLAHDLHRVSAGDGGTSAKKPKSKTLLTGVGIGAFSLFSVSIAFFLLMKKRKSSSSEKNQPPGWQPLFLHDAMGSTKNARVASKPVFTATNSMVSYSYRAGRMFILAEIKAATKNFEESLVIGNGGFGRVYKGEIEPGNLVAIKRANPMSQQGLAEFETEIEILSKLRHRHLVSMIGYCDENNEMILVYEYMANGTLRSHLYGNDNVPGLTWRQRIEACIGAARGLHYLHTGAERVIIHRDVKTTNILLDENFVAKMADFGLSKAGPTLDHTHVSTAVKGSFGYLDPEYFRRQQLTQKSDVYSFGVVMFEVVCARPVINPTLPKDQINLAEWAVRWQRQRSLDSIIDPRLEGDYSIESLKKFGEIAEKCLADDGKSRPTMGEVLWHLEYALQLHDAYTKSQGGDSFVDLSFSLPFIKDGGEGEDEDVSKKFEEAGDIRAEFPQIVRH